MAKYRNKKNGRIMEVIEEDKKYKTVLIRFEDNGEETPITTATLKRWYEELDEDEEEEEDDEDEDFEEEEEVEEDDDEEDDDSDDEEEEEDSDDDDDEDSEDEDDDQEEDDDEDDSEDDDSEDDDDEDEEEDSDDDDVDDEDQEEDDSDDEEDDDEEEEEEQEEEPEPKKKSTTKKPAKEKKEPTARKKSEESDAVKELVQYTEECVEEQGGEIFQPQSQPRNRAFKVGGHMYARLLYSAKSVTVACRQDAVSGTGIKPTKTIKHIFSDLYTFEKLDKTAKANIKKLLKVSYDYQVKKNNDPDKKKAGKKTGKKNTKKEK